MKKFSIIIPVYNTKEYLEKCLNSIINQKNLKNEYEIIIVNDGSTDESEKIIVKYEKKYSDIIKYIKKKNGGVSSARNIGIKESHGEYLLFVDSDDYLEPELLSKLENAIEEYDKPDIVRINSRDVTNNGETILEVNIPKIKNEEKLIKEIMKFRALEIPWGYAYKSSFFTKNGFHFSPQVHEDFGLIPIVLYKAKSIVNIDYIGYDYVEREQSLTAEKNYEKLKKRVDDFFILYKNHMKEIKKDSKKGKLLRSYSIEAMVNKLATLNDVDMNKKIKEVKEELYIADIYSYNFKKTVKKILLKISIKLYLNIYKKHKGW